MDTNSLSIAMVGKGSNGQGCMIFTFTTCGIRSPRGYLKLERTTSFLKNYSVIASRETM